MPPVNIWQSWKELLLLVVTGRNFDPLGLSLNYLCDVFLPNGLPRLLRRRLSSPPPQLFGEAMLCLVCCKIFEVHKHEHYFLYSWTSYRHQDDLLCLKGPLAVAVIYVRGYMSGWNQLKTVPIGATPSRYDCHGASLSDSIYQKATSITISSWISQFRVIILIFRIGIIISISSHSKLSRLLASLFLYCPPLPLRNTDICL